MAAGSDSAGPTGSEGPGPVLAPPGAGPRLVLAVTHPMTARYLLRGQARRLRDLGFDVWVVTSPGADLTAFQESESVPVATVPMRRPIAPLADLLAMVRLTRILRQLRPVLVNASTPKAGILGMLAAWLARVPIRVYTLRGLPMETATGMKRAALRWAETTAAALAHRVVCVGPSLRDRCLELGITTLDKATLVANGSSNGVDTERFRPTPERRAQAVALRRSLGIPPEAQVIGYVGRFTRDKGLDDLAAAFLDGVVPASLEAHLLLVGDFEDGDPVDPSTRRRLEASPRVAITGWVSDTAPYYAAMDLLTLPSYREGFPNAPLEAAASGRATVGYRAVGTVDAIEDGVTGTLVATGDRQALGSALVTYLEDGGLRRRHGTAARRRAETLFRREIVWQAWAEQYQRLLASELTGPMSARSRSAASFYSRAGKRALDFIGAATLLLALSPLLAVVAIAVRCALGRPILFRQTRPGRHGNPFICHKFRTMLPPGEGAAGRQDAERLTRFGAFLRRTSLDELPELWNVLRGEMSLVGPRPLLMRYLDRYTARQARRHEVRPGITGWSQVKGRNALSWETKLELDTWYVDNLGPLVDAKILVMTLGAVLRGRGVSAANHATMPEFRGPPE